MTEAHAGYAVLDGIDLAAKDATGTSDPFCELFLASNKAAKSKTKCIEATLNPNWGEIFTLYALCSSSRTSSRL